jgi:hypothetical protein
MKNTKTERALAAARALLPAPLRFAPLRENNVPMINTARFVRSDIASETCNVGACKLHSSEGVDGTIPSSSSSSFSACVVSQRLALLIATLV